MTFSLYLVWIGVAATLISMLLTRRTEEIEDLAESRGRLVAQALDSEDRERRRLAEALHDEAIQNLLAARHELSAGSEDGGTDLELVKLGLDRTVDQLRDAVFDLHPYVLEHAGLTPALEAFAERQARRGGFDWRVEVDPGAEGHADALLFSLARELITNVAKHAEAREVVVVGAAAGPRGRAGGRGRRARARPPGGRARTAHGAHRPRLVRRARRGSRRAVHDRSRDARRDARSRFAAYQPERVCNRCQLTLLGFHSVANVDQTRSISFEPHDGQRTEGASDEATSSSNRCLQLRAVEP